VEEGYRRGYTVPEDNIQQTRNAVYVKGKFLGTFSKECTNRAAAPQSVYAERIIALVTVLYFSLRLGTGLLTVATDCAEGLLSSKCYSVGPNFYEKAYVSNLVVFIGMGVMEPCHIVHNSELHINHTHTHTLVA
jgi:hypothetical protein